MTNTSEILYEFLFTCLFMTGLYSIFLPIFFFTYGTYCEESLMENEAAEFDALVMDAHG